MLARVLTLRFDPALETFDNGTLQEFLKAKEVHAIREHFFVRDGASRPAGRSAPLPRASRADREPADGQSLVAAVTVSRGREPCFQCRPRLLQWHGFPETAAGQRLAGPSTTRCAAGTA